MSSHTGSMIATAAVQAALIVIVAALLIWCGLEARRAFDAQPTAATRARPRARRHHAHRSSPVLPAELERSHNRAKDQTT